MCYKSTTTFMSPLPIQLAKISVVVLFFCFAECATGKCVNYGHSCWGAHGKRNSAYKVPTGELSVQLPRDQRWFLSRLVQNNPMHYEQEVPTNQQLFVDAQMEAEPFKGQEELPNIQDLFPNEDALFDYILPNERPRSNKLKSSKFLEKRSTKIV